MHRVLRARVGFAVALVGLATLVTACLPPPPPPPVTPLVVVPAPPPPPPVIVAPPPLPVNEWSVGGQARAIVSGPDGNMWFTDNVLNAIGRITPSGSVTRFALPDEFSDPAEIVLGPDGNLWFTEHGVGKVGRISPDGVISEFALSGTNTQPIGITAGSDGNIWFVAGPGGVNRITTAEPNTVTEFRADAPTYAITSGPGGDLWFTYLNHHASPVSGLGRVRVGAPNATTLFFLANETFPAAIVLGNDGNLWFTENGRGATLTDIGGIGRMTPAGVATEFRDGLALHAYPYGLAKGCGDNLWFTTTNSAGGTIGRISTSAPGTIAEYGIPAGVAPPGGIARGADNRMWYTRGDRIGYVDAC